MFKSIALFLGIFSGFLVIIDVGFSLHQLFDAFGSAVIFALIYGDPDA